MKNSIELLSVDENDGLKANIKNTFISVYKNRDSKNGLIYNNEDSGFFSFIYNPDFKYLINKNVNSKIILNCKEYYFFANWKLRFKLNRSFKKLWFQDKNNIMWLINILVAILAITTTLYQFW